MSLASILGLGESRVISVTVHEPPDPPSDRMDRAERLEFVRDGFTYSAAAFAPIWLLAKRQWLAFLLYLAVLAGLMGLLAALDAAPEMFLLVSSALHLVIGLEAGSIQRWTLSLNGYTMIGAVTGRTQLECERRFIEDWLPNQAVISVSAAGATAGRLSMAETGPGRGGMGATARSWLGHFRRS